MNQFKKSFVFCYSFMLISLLATTTFSQTINISPKTLYFGKIPEGKEAIRDLLIYNISLQPLTISKLRFQGTNASSFSLITDPTPATLGLAQLLVVPVKFVPISEGTASAQLVIESNASTSPDLAELTGEGTDLTNGFITFERIFGQPDGDGAGSIRETADGGYIIAGGTTLIDADYSDASLIKIDKYGQMEWSQTYGDEDWSEGFAEVLITPDGGYLAVGSHSYTEQLGEPDIYLVKTDAAGNLIWEKSYGKSAFKADNASEIIQATDGGYIIAGSTITNVSNDAYLIKIDDSGNIIWEKIYGGTGGENAASIKPTGDGSYIFVGSTSTNYTGALGDFDFYLVKIDATGNIIWEKHYGGTDWDQAGNVLITNDSGYLISGWTASPEFGAVARDVFLVKFDAAGNKQWQKLFGWEHHDGAAEVIATEDGGYLVAGSSERYYDAPL
ncbi:MAG: choice-of-anchor D domain-containing protein, partial [bacterium]|nr:choice-of-anchor D domain-containing protein [bacterium]